MRAKLSDSPASVRTVGPAQAETSGVYMELINNTNLCPQFCNATPSINQGNGYFFVFKGSEQQGLIFCPRVCVLS